MLAAAGTHYRYPNVNVVAELNFRQNIRFMRYEPRSKALRISQAPTIGNTETNNFLHQFAFAGGSVFSDSMLNTLLFQVRYGDLLSIAHSLYSRLPKAKQRSLRSFDNSLVSLGDRYQMNTSCTKTNIALCWMLCLDIWHLFPLMSNCCTSWDQCGWDLCLSLFVLNVVRITTHCVVI